MNKIEKLKYDIKDLEELIASDSLSLDYVRRAMMDLREMKLELKRLEDEAKSKNDISD